MAMGVPRLGELFVGRMQRSVELYFGIVSGLCSVFYCFVLLFWPSSGLRGFGSVSCKWLDVRGIKLTYVDDEDLERDRGEGGVKEIIGVV